MSNYHYSAIFKFSHLNSPKVYIGYVGYGFKYGIEDKVYDNLKSLICKVDIDVKSGYYCNYKIEIIEHVNCDNKKQLEKHKQKWVDYYGDICVNKTQYCNCCQKVFNINDLNKHGCYKTKKFIPNKQKQKFRNHIMIRIEEERQKALKELEKVHDKYTRGWLRYYKMLNDSTTIKDIKIVMESLTSDFMMKDNDKEYLI